MGDVECAMVMLQTEVDVVDFASVKRVVEEMMRNCMATGTK